MRESQLLSPQVAQRAPNTRLHAQQIGDLPLLGTVVACQKQSLAAGLFSGSSDLMGVNKLV